MERVFFVAGDPSDRVDGRNPAPVEVGSLSHYLQFSLHPRWLARFLPSTVGKHLNLYQIESSKKTNGNEEQKKYRNLKTPWFHRSNQKLPPNNTHKNKNTQHPNPTHPISKASASPSVVPQSIGGPGQQRRNIKQLLRAIDIVGIAWRVSSSPWRRSPVTTNAWCVDKMGSDDKKGWDMMVYLLEVVGWITKEQKWKDNEEWMSFLEFHLHTTWF